MKFCKDCVHFKEDTKFEEYHKCTRSSKVSLVTGEIIEGTGKRHYCSVEREFSWPIGCGKRFPMYYKKKDA